MTKLLLIFIILNIANVIIQTIKSIATIKCGKTIASVVNAVAYGLYTIVTVYMLCELPLATKAIVVALCNLIGVYTVKYFEEKAQKDKLWKVEMTAPSMYAKAIDVSLNGVPHSMIEVNNNYTLFNFYCETKKQSANVKLIGAQYQAKFFVAESKTL